MLFGMYFSIIYEGLTFEWLNIFLHANRPTNNNGPCQIYAYLTSFQQNMKCI